MIGSFALAILCVIVAICSNQRTAGIDREISNQGYWCACVFAIGCAVRFAALTSLPEGISAEEALTGVQAKALWQTGGFLFDGGLTAQLSQWTGESSGPLLSVLTAPFVGIFGMNRLTVRLPLALLSCASMPAAYSVGCQLSGRRAGRWCMTAYALCPYFVLCARMAYAAHAAIYLLPIALCLVLAGMKRPWILYPGMVLLGLMAYTQSMYFLLAPLYVVLGGAAAAHSGVPKRHAVCASLLGLAVCTPAMLTLWVTLGDGEAFSFLGVQIPKLQEFDKQFLFAYTDLKNMGEQLRAKTTATLIGALFQVLAHRNISSELFAPASMAALYFFSVPLVMLGLLDAVKRFVEGKLFERHGPERALVVLMAMTSFVCLVLFGSSAALAYTAMTNVLDDASFLIFVVLMMTAGVCRIERKSLKGASVIATITAISFAGLCMYLFGGDYAMQENVYFADFAQASERAAQLGEKLGTKVNVTSKVYPHIQPADAAEMMYLYASDADTRELAQRRGTTYEVIYMDSVETPCREQVYLAEAMEMNAWDLTPFAYEGYGNYAVIYPAGIE